MAQVRNENRFNVNDKVWWFDAWGTLRCGVVFAVVEDKGRTFYQTHEENKKGIQTGVEAGKCWPSKDACLEAADRESRLQVAEYKESIKDVNDLLVFLFRHDTTSELRDTDAVKAAQERAMELLGVELIRLEPKQEC